MNGLSSFVSLLEDNPISIVLL